MELLVGKRAIVAGGASGMGAATVRAYANAGASVVVMDVNDEVGKEVATTADGAMYIHCDLSNQSEVTSCFADAIAHLGGLDVLAVPAGVFSLASAAAEIPAGEFARVMAANVYGTIFANQAAFAAMRDAGGGSIINFGSSAGMSGISGAPAYSASKGAVLAWTRAIALEWGKHGIRVNAMAPGIRTPMYENSGSALSPEDREARDRSMASRMPLGDALGDPDRDFAPVMVFLASDGSRFITGQTLAVDGGLIFVR
jgi:NAD(P)-dependent dehydrogenase (short-subunit alcohol dehydrogenase family)